MRNTVICTQTTQKRLPLHRVSGRCIGVGEIDEGTSDDEKAVGLKKWFSVPSISIELLCIDLKLKSQAEYF